MKNPGESGAPIARKRASKTVANHSKRHRDNPGTTTRVRYTQDQISENPPDPVLTLAAASARVRDLSIIMSHVLMLIGHCVTE